MFMIKVNNKNSKAMCEICLKLVQSEQQRLSF